MAKGRVCVCFRSFVCVILACVFATSCTYRRTQAVLSIEADSVVQREATHIYLRTITPRGVEERTLLREELVAANGSFFPIRVALATRDPAARYTVSIEARKVERSGNTTVTTLLARNQARSSFVLGKVVRLPLWLLSGCACTAQQRCVPGPGFVPVCEPLDIDPIEDDLVDAAVIDAGIDGGVVDGGNQCTSGFHRCATACVPDGDVASCGQRCDPCVNVEGGTAVCMQGSCAVRCNGTRQLCGAACIDTSTNSVHCGACGRICTNTQVCQDGDCVTPPECNVAMPRSCPTGSYCNGTRCMSGCDEDLDCGGGGSCQLSTHECGCVGNARRCAGVCADCPSNATSTNCNAQNQCGAASCSSPRILCGASCTEESITACGASCAVCTAEHGTPACQSGSCVTTACSSGYLLCQGHCALCPVNAATTTCAGSDCIASSCPMGRAFCNGSCVAESAAQCGSACTACTAANGIASCVNGTCRVASCNVGYLLCGGQCRACPASASATSCDAQDRCIATACAPSFANCSGQCVPNSVNQCGPGCSTCTVSNGTPACVSGACRVSACNAGFQVNATQTACLDIDECISNNGGCGTLATCTNTQGSFVCNCPSPNRTCNAVCVACPTDAQATGTQCGGPSCVLSGCSSGFSLNASATACVVATPSGPWLQRAAQSITTRPSGSSQYARSITISPDGLRMFVGDAEYNTRGGVHTYSRNNATADFSSTSVQTLTEPSNSNRYGVSSTITPDGLRLLVGELIYLVNGQGQGAVHVYTRANSSALFSTTQAQMIDGTVSGANYGIALAMAPNGLEFAVGDFRTDSVHWYRRSSATAMFPLQPTGTISAAAQAVHYGQDGLTLFVGLPESGSGQVGTVAVYSRATLTSPFTTASQTLTGPSGSVDFGTAIEMSPDGLVLLVGDAGAAGGGRVLLYRRTSLNVSFGTTLTQQLSAPSSSDSFGIAIAMTPDAQRMYIGDTRYVGGSGTGTGVVWTYTQ